MNLALVSILLCSILAAYFIITRIFIGGPFGILAKTIASIGFVISGLLAISGLDVGKNLIYFIIIEIGLILGMIGDIILDMKVVYKEHSDIYLNSGMLAFTLGHFSYATAISLIALKFVSLLSPILWSLGIALVAAPAIIFASKALKIDFGKFFWQSMLYCFVLVFMFAYSIFLACQVSYFIYFAIGMGLFFASDMVLSLQYFGNKLDNKLLITANHILYYAAQILVVCFLFFF